MVRRVEAIETLIEPTLEQLGLELLGCERCQGDGHGAILRVYIDHPNGITVDDCAKASRHISAILDVEDAIPGHYNLEVSSPGINRPLFSLAHFAKVVGSKVYVKLHTPEAGRRQWTGMLTQLDGDNLYLDCAEAGEIDVHFNNVEKAHLCAED